MGGLRIGSLFSGVGGLDLGLEWAGVGHPAWFAECEPYPASILRRRWPGVPVVPDVRDVTPTTCGPIDVMAGGFPCQDISLAGKGAGLAGERSGLFFEMMRVAREFAPRFIVFENVAAIRSRGLDAVLAELDAAGYEAAWSTFGADAVGAPHRRLRWWCVAWRKGEGTPPASGLTWGMVGAKGKPPAHGVMAGGRIMHGVPWAKASRRPSFPTPVASSRRCEGDVRLMRRAVASGMPRHEAEAMVSGGLERPQGKLPAWRTPQAADGRQSAGAPSRLLRDSPGLTADLMCHEVLGSTAKGVADSVGRGGVAAAASAVRSSGLVMSADWCEALMGFPQGWTADDDAVGAWLGWPARPGEGRTPGEPRRAVKRGTQPGRGKRIKALGNAVVPQCAELVGRQLLRIAGAA